LQTRHGVDQHVRDWHQRRQTLAQPGDRGVDPLHVSSTGTLRAIAQLFAALHGMTFLQRL